MRPDVVRQREYYARTASEYDTMHVAEVDEHTLALSMFSGIVDDHPGSILDVGAGTGRAVRLMKRRFPQSKIVGVEPSDELRRVGHERHQLSSGELVSGDATSLPFDDNAFDWVIETGVLHHVRDFKKAVSEMTRVARLGLLISDSNNMGQGSGLARLIKQAIKRCGLWSSFISIQTMGRGYKYSDGDGVYYSFCAFDCVPIIREKFSQIIYANTMAGCGPNLYRTAPHVAIMGLNRSMLK